jgi:hypothetical protein
MMRSTLLLALLLPVAAVAQSPSDVAYCRQLANLYDRYVGLGDYGTTRGANPGSTESQLASAQCRAGNIAGIPSLERILQRNGFTLPPRS